MQKSEINKMALEAMILINASITNIRLYPPASNLIGMSIDKAYSTLASIFAQEDSIVFAETEKSLLVLGEPLGEKDQKKPQVISVLEMLLNFGIKSLAFDKGLDTKELRTFLEILSRKSDDILKEGGLGKVVERHNLRHILVDQKVYVSVEKDQKVVSGQDAKAGELLKHILGEGPASGADSEKIREMAKDPEWLSKVLQSGMKHITREKGGASGSEISESFTRMIRTLDGVAGKENKEKLLQQMAASLAGMDDDVIQKVLAQNLEGAIGEGLMDKMADRLGVEKLKQLAPQTAAAGAAAVSPKAPPEPSGTERRSGQDRRKEHGAEYFAKGGVERRKTEDQRTHHINRIKAGLNSILKGEKTVFADKEVMLSLPMAIRQLYSKGQQKTVEALFDRLNDGLSSDDPDVREEIFQVLSVVGANLVSDRKLELMIKLSYKLVLWIKFGTSLTAAFQLICNSLMKLAQFLILDGRFSETNHILEAFYLISSGKIKKDAAIRELSDTVLSGIMSGEVLDLLLTKFLTGEAATQLGAAQASALLGAASVAPLSDIFREVQGIPRWDRILKYAADAAPPAAPEEARRLQEQIRTAIDRIVSQNEITEPLLAAVRKGMKGVASADRKAQSAAHRVPGSPAGPAVQTETTPGPKPIDRPPAGEKVADAVERAMGMIMDFGDDVETAPTPAKKVSPPPEPAAAVEPAPEEPPADDLDRHLQTVDGYVAKNDTASAVTLLFDLIVKYAKAKDFSRAETLRDKLYEVDPMALTEILKSGEIIEEEKSGSMDQAHLDSWPELYGALSGEESNTLYYALQKAEYDKNQTIIKQGEQNDNLYFIDAGQLKMTYHAEGKETQIGTLGVGDFFGAENFFTLSVCTTSVTATSPVKLHVLNKAVLPKWKKDFPALGSRLSDYCHKRRKTYDLLKQKGLDRRTNPRKNVRGKVAVQILDASGKPVDKVIQENIEDVSAGGLSFFTKIAKEDIAQKYFNRNLILQFILQAGASQHKGKARGKIVCVLNHLASDYSIHAKFQDPLDDTIVKAIDAVDASG